MHQWRIFTLHPASVGETYLQHLLAAAAFGVRMWVGGTACLVHALFPFLCVRTGSDCVAGLYSRMMVRRGGSSNSALILPTAQPSAAVMEEYPSTQARDVAHPVARGHAQRTR